MKITIKSLSKLVLAAVFSVFALTVSANEEHTATDHAAAAPHGEAHHDKFDAGAMIIDHIGDGYGWHLWGHTSLPLPVILYTDKGLEVFSSNRLGHDPHYEIVQGQHYNYKLVEGKVLAVDAAGEPTEANANIYDFSITKNVAALLITVLLVVLVFFSVANGYKTNKGKAPSGVQSFFEPIILFLRDDVAKPAIGHHYEQFMPFLLTVFFFILFSNLLGLIPVIAGANLTGNIAVAAVLAAFTFIYVTIKGNGNYWSHIFFMPGVPKPVLLILTPIEILGVFLRPFVLMVRLFANITAGHIIALSFFGLIFIFGEMNQALGYGVGFFSVAFAVFMSLLEVLVAFIQAYVFTLLSAMYLGAATEEAHH